MLSVSGRGVNSQTTVEARAVAKTVSYRRRALLTVLVVNGTIIGFEALLAYNGLSLKMAISAIAVSALGIILAATVPEP